MCIGNFLQFNKLYKSLYTSDQSQLSEWMPGLESTLQA